jgi:hypothetical protein
MRWTLDGSTPTAAQVATRPLRGRRLSRWDMCSAPAVISASRRCGTRVSRSFVRALVGEPMGARTRSGQLVREIGGSHVD